MNKINIEGIIYTKIHVNDLEKELPKLLKKNFQWVTWHWTGGRYNKPSNSYQINVGEDYILVANLLTQDNPNIHGHTWKRNTNNLGCSFMGMWNKDFPITSKMIETGSKLNAVIKKHINLNWSQFKDHSFWAEIDGYKGLRWDINLIYKDQESKKTGRTQESLLERLIRKGNWYLSKI